MNYYITSDTHFNHSHLIDLSDRKSGFEKKILNGFKVLKPGDILIHLGDICIGGDKEVGQIFRALQKKGIRTILVRGNHDHKSYSWYLENGWDFVCEQMVMKFMGKNILFSHILEINLQGDVFANIDLNIHGHYHSHSRLGSAYDHSNHYLIAIEEKNYIPESLKNIIEKHGNKKA